MVGLVTEPRVTLDRPAINFGQVQVGVRGKQVVTLINNEALPFAWSLDRSTYDATPELLAAAGNRTFMLAVMPGDAGLGLCMHVHVHVHRRWRWVCSPGVLEVAVSVAKVPLIATRS